MGGNKGQRSKTKPSKSEKSAQILATRSGNLGVTGFIGFGSNRIDEDDNYQDTSASDERDQALDPNFRVVFKKMMKKDILTKIKALQEFSELCQKTEDPEDLKSVLPNWSRIFCKHSIDNDWRLRETLFKTHNTLAIKVGRSIAPHLKQLMPFWLLALFDPYAPAATAANQSFNTTFPPNKQAEVLMFCKSEIFTYFVDLIIVQTTKTIGDSHQEDIELKYERLVSGALLALSMFISICPTDSKGDSSEDIIKLLSEPNFWKHRKGKYINIKVSWYKLISSICQHSPNVAQQFSDKICTCSFDSLTHNDPVLARVIWENILWVISTIKDFSSHINVQKMLLPQLKIILSEGGRGNASVIFPNLLPLISKIPEFLDNTLEFYHDIFKKILTGLSKATKYQSEYNAVIQASFELVRFFIVNKDWKNMKNQFESFIIHEFIKTLIFIAMFDVSSVPANSPIFNEIFNLLIITKKDIISFNNELLESLKNVCKDIVNDSRFNMEKTLPRLSNFLSSFSGQKKKNFKSVKGVKFQLEANETSFKISQNINSCELATTDDNILLDQTENLTNCIGNIIFDLWNEITCNLYPKNQDISWIKFMINLTKHRNFSNALIRFHEKEAEYELKFWTEFIGKKLKNLNLSDQQMIKSLVELSFNMAMKSSTPDNILLELMRIEANNVIYYTLEIFESDQRNPIVKTIISSDLAFETASNIADKLVTNKLANKNFDHENCKENMLWKTLQICFSFEGYNQRGLENVVEKFKICLHEHKSECPSQILFFICEITQSIIKAYKPSLWLESSRSLLISLFELALKTPNAPKKLEDTWMNGVESLIKNNGAYLSEDGFIMGITLTIKNFLNGEIKSIAIAENTALVILKFIKIVFEVLKNFEKKTSINEDHLNFILSQIILSSEDWLKMSKILNHQAFSKFWLNGVSLSSDEEFNSNTKPFDITSFEYSALCTTIIFDKLLTDKLISHSKVKEIIINQLPHVYMAKFLCFETQISLQSEEKQLKELNSYLNLYMQNILDICDEEIYELLFQKLDQLLNPAELISFQLCASSIQEDILLKIFKDVSSQFLSKEKNIDTKEGIYFLSIINSILNKSCNMIHFEESIQPLYDHFINQKIFDLKIDQYNQNMSSDSQLNLEYVCLIVDFFKFTVNSYSKQLTQIYWDFILCSLIFWLQNIVNDESKKPIIFYKLICRLFELSSSLKDIFECDTSELLATTVVEWNGFHSKNIYKLLFPIFLNINTILENLHAFQQFTFASIVGNSIIKTDVKVLKELNSNEKKDEYLITQENTESNLGIVPCTLPSNETYIIEQICPMLISNFRSLSIACHTIIEKILNERNLHILSIESQDKDFIICPPKPLMQILEKTDPVINIMLSEYSVGECCCIVSPSTDSYVYTMSYLIVWLEIIELLDQLNAEYKSPFCSYLKETNLFYRLLSNLFRLIPVSQDDIEEKDISLSNMFMEPLKFDICQKPSVTELQHISCQLYLIALEKMPASVRQWLSHQDKRVVDSVNSGLICEEELKVVQAIDTERFKNMTIKARPNSREVVANYSIEDMSIDLTIQLPINHPLGVINIESGRRVGVSSTQWRTWLLQLTTFLSHQNGSVLDGLSLWKKNIDKKFEGIEECMICFYVFHGSTCQLPRLSCRNCKKRFHSACLYKWFNTSNNATCPLCRNLF